MAPYNPKDPRAYAKGQVENQPGHKAFVDYSLPEWVRHPLKAQPRKVALLFPGEQNHSIGMLKDASAARQVKEMISQASEVFGFDVAALMANGPKEKMAETLYNQPLTYVADCVAFQVLSERKPAIAGNPQAVAGFSVGELAALYAAGVITYEQGLDLVSVRAEALQELEDEEPMEALLIEGYSPDKVEKLCKKASDLEKTGGDDRPFVAVARVLWPNCFVCAGKRSTVLRVQALEAQESERAVEARLLDNHVHAGHTTLAQDAADQFAAALDKMLPKMKPPSCELYLNTNGYRIPPGTPPDAFIQILKDSLIAPLHWLSTIVHMMNWGVMSFYECGPGKSLKGYMARYEYVQESPHTIRHPGDFTINISV